VKWWGSKAADDYIIDVLRSDELWEQERAGRLKALHARTAELEAELEALQPPPDIYRITRRFEDGTFTVWRWAKRILHRPVYVHPLQNSLTVEDCRTLWSGYDTLREGLPSHKAAEGWLRAYLDPTTNQTGYDAEGKRIA
jgi:hypothetical protein